MDRINEEVSKKSLLERLYTKNEQTKSIFDQVFSNKTGSEASQAPLAANPLDQYSSFLLNDDEEDENSNIIIGHNRIENKIEDNTNTEEVVPVPILQDRTNIDMFGELTSGENKMKRRSDGISNKNQKKVKKTVIV